VVGVELQAATTLVKSAVDALRESIVVDEKKQSKEK
jgi:hypothetical protein